MLAVSFDNLIKRVEALRSLCVKNLGSQEIHDISVDRPAPPFDELYFRKAVSWCYVLFQETGPFMRFSEKQLRTRAAAHEKFRKTRQLVECARTVHAHNLRQERQHDGNKRRSYDIWIMSNGGEPVNWERCSWALMNDVNEVLFDVEEEWRRRCEEENDRKELWREYELEKRTFWEAHDFDCFIVKAAEEAGLDGFDSTVFRKEGDRVERWRKLVNCFDTRGAAEIAIARAISTEIFNVFGRDR